jgi:outer membrane immunogenic protein
MQRSIALGLGMLVMSAGVAAADDTAAAHDWSGFSIGAFGGYQGSHFEQSELFTDAFGGNWWFPPGPNPGYDFDDNGAIYGLQADWNRQDGNIVMGVGLEVGSLNISAYKEDPNSPPIPFPGPGGPVTEFDADMFGSLTGRAGFASGRLFAYVRGGVSLVDASAKTVDACARSFCGQLTITAKGEEMLFGLTAGAGLDYAISDNVTIGAEYRLYKFEDLKVSGVASNFLTYHQTIAPDIIHTARISLNYRF